MLGSICGRKLRTTSCILLFEDKNRRRKSKEILSFFLSRAKVENVSTFCLWKARSTIGSGLCFSVSLYLCIDQPDRFDKTKEVTQDWEHMFNTLSGACWKIVLEWHEKNHIRKRIVNNHKSPVFMRPSPPHILQSHC